ncbi:MAG: hypothetical protein ACOYMG_19470 [Candidatus Methylumidiphilus sp.]
MTGAQVRKATGCLFAAGPGFAGALDDLPRLARKIARRMAGICCSSNRGKAK